MLYATHAPVDLAAIRHNLLGARERIAGRELMLAVKANAYGHGAVEVSRMVERTGCADRLAVATVPEALELREAGITLPVLKLSHCFDEELDAAVGARISLTVVDEHTVRAAQDAARRAGVRQAVHLKVDTGMRRIGTEPGHAVELARLVDQCPDLHLEGLFTHPPVSDTPSQDDFTHRELALFRDVADEVAAARGPVELVHFAPSGAILAHDLAGTTMVRAGIMAYGHYPDAATPRTVALRPAMGLVSRVSFVKRVLAGETVGYGRTWVAPRDTWVATIPVGYADGWSRANSNRGRVLVGGRSCPVVGRVCMDQAMVDLGPEDPTVRVGDEVVLLGRQGEQEITAEELADLMGTISYEVTCLVGPRVPRVHRDQG